MEQTDCSETLAYKIQMLGNYPEENIQHTEHGESLKSGMKNVPYWGSSDLRHHHKTFGCHGNQMFYGGAWGLRILSMEHSSFLISNFRRVLYVVCFLLGNSPASEFYMPTFRNNQSVPSSWRWNRLSVSKCWHIKFRCQGITQKKACNILHVTILVSILNWESWGLLEF